MIKKVQAALVAVSLFGLSLPSYAAGVASEADIRSAWALYTQQKFAPSADAFENLVRSSSPNSRLYYYAAAANKAAGRTPRAKQLSQYVLTNFGASAEAAHVVKLFPELSPSQPAAASSPSGLPNHLKGKSIDELMKTEEGRNALKAALVSGGSQSTSGGAATGGAAAARSVASGGAGRSSVSNSSSDKSSTSSITRPRDAAFTAEIIGAEGAEGITHFGSSFDSFECALAAMTFLPRGREILASMIRCPSSQDIYMVRFPGTGHEYQITPQKMEQYQMKDKALWATLLHCAYAESPAQGIEQNLTLLTGHPSEKLLATNITEQGLVQFLSDAVKKQHPIICISDDKGSGESLVEYYQGYTITGFDSNTGMITLRNPHGANSRRFRMKTDAQHKKFEQLNDGYLKMHVSLFPLYFKEVAKSPI